ncbi:MAG: DUF3500 domain-containing protein [Thermomicrobiales bacterium]|nr:DUF3500 domain-containing protein [Thermomicrobiales bacterium]
MATSLLNKQFSRRHFLGAAAASTAMVGTGFPVSRVAAQSTAQVTAIEQIVQAAVTFLETLSEEERIVMLFDWSDEAQKRNWSNFPAALDPRDGLMWGNLSEVSQAAWLPVMQATLSEDGYRRVTSAWTADEVLKSMEANGEIPSGGPGGNNGNQGGPGGSGTAPSGDATNQGGPGGGESDYGSDNFYIAFIGEPSTDSAWQWQFTGHHTTVNATIVNGRISLTPCFFGAQPTTYTDDTGEVIRPIGDMNDAAFTLINALDTDQQAQAVLGSQHIDLVSGPNVSEVVELAPEGILIADLAEEQQEMVTTLVGMYTGSLNDEHAAARLAEVTDVYDQTYFAWFGPTEWDSAAYWRVAGPTIIVEYSPQDQLTDDPRDHIHAIYRDPSNEYGIRYQ